MSDLKEVSEEGKAGMFLLQLAFEADMVATIATTRKNGTEVDLLCIVTDTEDGGAAVAPVAEFITGNPFEQYNAPGEATEVNRDDAVNTLAELVAKGLTPGKA